MSSTFGKILRLSVFGQSHSAGIGFSLDGFPAGFPVDMEALSAFMSRRAPGKNEYSTPRREKDIPEFISGIVDGVTCGAPIAAVIFNSDVKKNDYANLKSVPRPGHADFTAEIKYGGYQDKTGGGHFSGRLTAPICAAGALCIQLLKSRGIEVAAHIKAIHGVCDAPMSPENILSARDKPFPVISAEAGEDMRREIADAKSRGDSVGGIIECAVLGLPPGVGDPMFDGMENRIAGAVFAVPAIKGIEFGAGFGAASMYGTENNDPFYCDGTDVRTSTNNSGGILGGITTGMPLVFSCAVKPTPSVATPQKSVDMVSGQNCNLEIHGRHDPCIVPRAVPCIEAAAALAVTDALIECGIIAKGSI